MKDTIYKKEDFHKFPFNREWDHSNMSLVKGGYGFPDGTWLITIIRNQECDADIYELPDILQHVMNRIYQWGEDNKVREINRLLDHGLIALGRDKRNIP